MRKNERILLKVLIKQYKLIHSFALEVQVLTRPKQASISIEDFCGRY